MRNAWGSLRVRLAVLGFAAIYLPVLILFGVTVVTNERVSETRVGNEVRVESSSGPSPWVLWTVVGLAPAAACLSWWLAGRAVRPIERVRAVAEEIEASDLSRRIDLRSGPIELRSLAASFDAMLDRLERSADAQRRLIEDTSHDLRTPLSVLAMNSEVLLSHPQPTAEIYREGLERSREAALRMQATIDELLVDARGRARTLDRNPTDLLALVSGVVEHARVLADASQVMLSLSGQPRVICRLDEPTIERAVSNLLDNAIAHAPRGTGVEIEVTAEQEEAVILVVDHGPGIPVEQQSQIFERFWSGEMGNKGTGLGLPIARQIALAHGGDLHVASPGPDGDGAAFRLRLRR